MRSPTLGPKGAFLMTDATSPKNASEANPSGLPAALAAYTIWGFLPLYILLVSSVPPFEFVGWRIIWTLPLCLIIVAFRRQVGEIKRALGSLKTMLALFASAALIAANWFIYIWAIMQNQVYATSLGYYLNPLLNVLLGTLLLGERLSKLQWLAVAIAACAVAILSVGALTSLWISLSLALSFGLYGIVRKQVDVGALPGLTIETMILIPAAILVVLYYAVSPAGSTFGKTTELSALMVFSGVVTAVPLLLFAIAARRMPYSTLGFIQYLAPTIVFLLGLFVFGQQLRTVQLASFLAIWTAIVIFVADIWWRSRKAAVIRA